MILVIEDKVVPENRFLDPEIARLLPVTEYHVYPEVTDIPPL